MNLYIKLTFLSLIFSSSLAVAGVVEPFYKSMPTEVYHIQILSIKTGDKVLLLDGSLVDVKRVLPRLDGSPDKAGTVILSLGDGYTLQLFTSPTIGKHYFSEAIGYPMIVESGVNHAKIDIHRSVPGRYLVQEEVDVKFTLAQFLEQDILAEENSEALDAFIDFVRPAFVFESVPDGGENNIVYDGSKWLYIDWDGPASARYTMQPDSTLIFRVNDPYSDWHVNSNRRILERMVLNAWAEEAKKESVKKKIERIQALEKDFHIGRFLEESSQRQHFANYLASYYDYSQIDKYDEEDLKGWSDHLLSEPDDFKANFAEYYGVFDHITENQFVDLHRSSTQELKTITKLLLSARARGRHKIAQIFEQSGASLQAFINEFTEIGEVNSTQKSCSNTITGT